MKVPNNIGFLKTCVQEISKKVDCINAVVGCLNELQELMTRVDTLKAKIKTSSNLERGDSSRGFVAHMEQQVKMLDI